MSDYQNLDQLFTGIANSIRAKLDQSSSIKTTDMPSLIDSIEGGGGSSSKSDVNFYDYDGTILHSYTKAEALALTELPQLPTRTGFTCQCWNYTLAQLKIEVNDHDKCDVGAIYITDDGKTRIKIKIESKFYSNIPLYFNQTSSNGVTIDWGDGSSTETMSGTGNKNTLHQYSSSSYPAEYTITLNCNSGTMSFYTNIFNKFGSESSSNVINVWTSMIKEVNIGDKVTSIGNGAFIYCSLLQSVTISSSVTSVGGNAFNSCYSLQSINIPSSVTSIKSYAFNFCHSLQSVTIPSSVTSIGFYAFQYCYSLQSINIPSSVTSIESGVFYSCYSLTNLTIPSSTASIGSGAFQNCYSVQSINIPSSVTSIKSDAFRACYSLQSINIPSSVTSIGQYAFSGCSSIQSINIPSSVASIESSVLRYCSSIQSINIPSSVTSIGPYVFDSCYGLKVFDFSSHTSIPTLSYVNAFYNTPSTKYIVVPDDLYNDWITASNWSSSDNQIKESIIKKSDFDLL